MTNQILDLNLSIEEVVHPTFIIDNESYDLAVPDDLSVPQLRTIYRLWKYIEEADQAENYSEKQGEQYESNLIKILNLVAPTLPTELSGAVDESGKVKEIGKLRRSQKVAIAYSFLVNAPTSNPILSQLNLASRMPSLDSNGTIMETPTDGSE